MCLAHPEFVKVRDVITTLRRDGWRLHRTTGSHRHFVHPTKAGIVTVAGRPGSDVPIGTLRAVFRQAGLDWKGEPS